MNDGYPVLAQCHCDMTRPETLMINLFDISEETGKYRLWWFYHSHSVDELARKMVEDFRGIGEEHILPNLNYASPLIYGGGKRIFFRKDSTERPFTFEEFNRLRERLAFYSNSPSGQDRVQQDA